MVNKLSTRAKLIAALREAKGTPLSGNKLAQHIGVSRVAVWKGIQGLVDSGYPVETRAQGYALDPRKATDFLYPWEFGERESMFRHFANTGSTMDRAREFALQGVAGGTIITAERQNAGRGRNGRIWASRQGGLFCTILDRPAIGLADYCLPAMLYQIAIANTLTAVCGKFARLRWPNDIYIHNKKIAGVMTELAGAGDAISWLSTGIGVNVNNPAPSAKTASCGEIAGHTVSRREILLTIINEAEKIRKRVNPGTAYAQGNRLLAEEWNSLADRMGARAALVDSGWGDSIKAGASEARGRVLAKGIFAGVDPAGRCIIKSEQGKGTLFFNPGPVSIIFL